MNELNALKILLWVMHGRCRTMLALNERFEQQRPSGSGTSYMNQTLGLFEALCLLVGWYEEIKSPQTFAWLRKPLFYCQFEKQESLFVWNIIFLRQQMTDLIDVCRFESGREQIYTVMKYLLNLIWKFLLSLKGSF